jgi:hypothetical protein
MTRVEGTDDFLNLNGAVARRVETRCEFPVGVTQQRPLGAEGIDNA